MTVTDDSFGCSTKREIDILFYEEIIKEEFKMLNAAKILFKGEKAVRKINRKGQEILVDQLVREDLELDEKKQVIETVKDMMVKDDEWEEGNSDYWYKYGKTEGEIKGMLKAAGAIILGLAIKKIISK